ncbi:uncharacterized protein KY384_002883 [Bacidia gigantensis]|uniref:uncharacterized protein n=1 Tax=Bacidia gigantensis TaxID=2732470 RepID=UPI001D051530|nr:uncharacterized protein KY384_002883 [Bacidia gigantensis]KAG8532398.1 hypothetical protein KY384_002883 [Bacidia gigantensis]
MDSVRNALNAVLNPPRNRLNAFRHDWTHNYTSWQKWRLIVSIIGILSLPVVLFECELASPYPLASQQTFTLDFTGSHHVVATMDNTSFSPLGSALFGKLEVGYGSYEPASGVEFSEEQKQAKAKTFYPQSVAGAQTGDSYHWDLDVEGSGDLDVVRRDSKGWILVMKEDDGTLDSGPRTNQFNEGDSLGPDMSGGFAWDGNYVFQGRAGWKPEGTHSGRPEWQVTVMVADLKPQGNWLTQTWSRLSR